MHEENDKMKLTSRYNLRRRSCSVKMAQPSPASVTPSAKDDPMDLGPFLKEYVLNNPFTQAQSTPPPKPHLQAARQQYSGPVVAVKSRPLLAPSPPRLLVPSCSASSSPVVTAGTTTISQIPVLAVKAIPSPIVQQVAPIVHHQAAPITAPTINPMAIRLAASNANNNLPVGLTAMALGGGGDIGLVDTPKAHIGSNRNFAAMLREAKLPIKHIKVKKWLLNNYRHRGNSPNWLSSDDLLDHAHELFADLKSSVMSRIMKVTFPNCHKVINKYGYFYIGLVRRPQKQHYGDEILRMAAEAISTGRMTSDMACQVHGVSSELLDRMVVWFDTLNDPVPEDKQQSTDPSSDPDWVMTETDSESDGNQPEPRSNLKWKLREKARSRLLTKMKDAAERDSSPDFNWTPNNRGVRPYAACRARKRRRRTNSLDENEVQVKKERQDEEEEEDEEEGVEGSLSDADDDTRMDGEDGSSEASLPVINAIGSVKVKSEPLDPEYEPNNNNKNDSPIHSSPDDVKESFHTLRNLLSEKPVSETLAVAAAMRRLENLEATDLSCKKVATQEVAVVTTSSSSSGCNGTTQGTRSQSLNSVVDLLTMKQELQRTRDDLNVKTSQNNELESKLKEAHSEIDQLQKTVSSQETQLFDLASEFFELSNRFMKMTHKFKQALTDVKASQSHRT